MAPLRGPVSVVWSLVTALASVGCNEAAPKTASGDAAGGVFDGAVRDATLVDASPTDTAPASAHAHVVWLNFAGGKKPTLLGNGHWDIPMFTGLATGTTLGANAFEANWQSNRDSVMADLAARVRSVFSGFDVEVTTRRPVNTGYVEVVLGGTDQDRGRTEPCARLGFAPLLCGVVGKNERRIAHVNSDCFVEWNSAPHAQLSRVQAIAHELGHAYGLAHVQSRTSIMAPALTGVTTWGAGQVVNGPDVDGNCGRTTQNDSDVLTVQLGAAVPRLPAEMPTDKQAPLFSVSPSAEQTVSGESTLCVRTEEASSLAGDVFLEVYARQPSLEYFRLTRVHAPGPAPQFPSFTTLLGAAAVGPIYVRLFVGDEHGNLGEVRFRLNLDAQAPVRRCASVVVPPRA